MTFSYNTDEEKKSTPTMAPGLGFLWKLRSPPISQRCARGIGGSTTISEWVWVWVWVALRWKGLLPRLGSYLVP